MVQENISLQTKHEQITTYIKSLETGTRISVRKIAKDFEVSEGTAYRAIKEAENLGIVVTKRRIGTIRVEKKEERRIDRLNFAEIVNSVDGVVLGGANGLQKTLNKFVVGAMELEAMLKYIESGDLLIVGNRTQAHLRALGQGAGILITGGFDASSEARALADERELPIISTSYDTFTVATIINRAIAERLIKKKILAVEDIIRPGMTIYSLRETNTVKDMQKLVEQTTHTRYPVLDEEERPVGIITTKDIVGVKSAQTIGSLMTANPMVISPNVSVTSAGYMMIWEGIELLPVIDKAHKMIGIISRKDVLEAMQSMQKQPQIGETYEVQLWSEFAEMRDRQGKPYYRGTITAQMTNFEGMVSEGMLTTLMIRAAYRCVQDHKKRDVIVDSTSNFYLEPLQIDDVIEIVPAILELSRRYCKIDIEVLCRGSCVARSMFTARIV